MNIVGVYENFGVSARLAYNWRGSFLNNASKGNNRNPVYTGSLQPVGFERWLQHHRRSVCVI